MSEIFEYDKAMFIDDYDNYLLFTNGNILNCDTDKWINGTKDKGYIRVTLSKDKKEKKFYIHQLLGKAFIPNPDNKQCIDHINHIKDDNRIENLRWVNHNENMKNHSKRQNTLFRGVSYHDNRWRSSYCDTEGKLKFKNFSVKKFGNKQALKLAIEARYQAELLYDYTILQTPEQFFNSDVFINIEN